MCYVQEILDSMFAYQIIDLLIKFLTVVVAFIGAYVAYKKYSAEKNKEIYEKRLNTIYAPLYGRLVQQETLRSLKLSSTSRYDEPILKVQAITKSGTLTLKGIEWNEGEETEHPLNSSRSFVRLFFENEDCKGLARPQLLKLIYQYELLENEGNDKGTINARKQVGRLLVNEIISGYKDTMKALGLDDNKTLEYIDFFNIEDVHKES